jgi:hypothetical protein
MVLVFGKLAQIYFSLSQSLITSSPLAAGTYHPQTAALSQIATLTLGCQSFFLNFSTSSI